MEGSPRRPSPDTVTRGTVLLLGLAAASLVAALGMRAARDWPVWMVLRRTALGARIHAAGGDPIDPRSVVVTAGADGTLHLDGRKTDLAGIRSRFPGRADLEGVKDSVLLELHPAVRIADIRPLFEALIVAGWINLQILASTPVGPRALPLPTPGDSCCIVFYLRSVRHEVPAGSDRLWLRAEALPEGDCLVKELIRGDRPELPLQFPERRSTMNGAERPATKPAPEGPRPWTGVHPPFGPFRT